MSIESKVMSVAAGLLIAGAAFSVYLNHCLRFAVDCF